MTCPISSIIEVPKLQDLPALPPNPNYGKGFFVRALQITTPAPGRILLGMEDIGHALQIAFEHDGARITAIEGRWQRHPLSSCTGAAAELEKMVGCPLGDNVLAPRQFADERQHCTHFFDMLRLGITHAWHRREDRRYEVFMADAPQGPLVAELTLNGQQVMALTLDNYVIAKPDRFAGVSIFEGFMKWAAANLSPEDFEYAFIVQRAVFVSRGRLLDMRAAIGLPAELSGPPIGSCYGSQPQRIAGAVRLPTHVSFDERAEVLRLPLQ